MNIRFFFIVLIAVSNIPLVAQHLPLKIGNQWHYNQSLVPPGINYAAITVDTTTINGKSYFKMERRHASTGEIIAITYDRFEGDSSYYRLSNNEDSLIINFNWSAGHTIVTTNDSVCYNFYRLGWIGTRNVWGFTTDSYLFQIGFWCVGMQDTAWALYSPEIVREFGCYSALEGMLIGAVINGITYGTLHPLPVELISFFTIVTGENIQLNWLTAAETNNQGFEIQRQNSIERSQKTVWEIIGFVEGSGTTTETKFYSFIDKDLSPGIYQYRLKQIDFDGTFEYSQIVEVTVQAPSMFSLSQNYPNPFNPLTKIKYQIPSAGTSSMKFVQLIVYDVLGNEVATLVNEEKSAGNYEIEFDASEFPSGVYFYQLKAGSFIQTRKMVILK